jgi:hypothetical protein
MGPGAFCAMTLDDFRYLWEAPTTRYLLLRVPGRPINEAMVFDPETRTMMLIEDDDLYRQVTERMLEAGFSVVDDPPDASA